MFRNTRIQTSLILALFLTAPLALSNCSQTQSTTKDDTVGIPDSNPSLLKPRTEPFIAVKAQEGGTLRRPISSFPTNFNWLTQYGVDVRELRTYVHNTFATRDPVEPNKWISELAEKIELSADKRVYTIHLRRGVYWQTPNVDFSTGKYDWLKEKHELTAEDAVFLFDMILDPAVQVGPIQSRYRDLDHAEVIDRYTFKVVWKRRTYRSKELTLSSYPLPKWLFAKNEDGSDILEDSLGEHFNTHWSTRYPLGTGPYQITKADEERGFVLERNDLFWGSKPPINTIEYRIIRDSNTAYYMLNGKALDLVQIPPALYKQDILDGPARKSTGIRYKAVSQPAYFYIGWNAQSPLFSDARVRRAMTHALDREGIIAQTLNGLGQVITGPYLPQHPGNNPQVKAYEYSLDKAAKLLKDAGWEDTNRDGVLDKVIDGNSTDFHFKIMTYDNPTARKYMVTYQHALLEIGIFMSPEYIDWATMRERMNARDFDAFIGAWGIGWVNDLDQIWHSAQSSLPGGVNRVAFRNARADEIIEALDVTFNMDERIELLREFHLILHEQQPYTFFYQPQVVYAWSPRLQNMSFQPWPPQPLSIPWWVELNTH